MIEKVVGQQKIKDLFIRSLRGERLGHSYALVGEAGMGKKTLAENMAAMVVCQNKNGCGVCKECLMAAAGTHPDIEYVLPEEGKKNITVNSVRALIEKIYVRPYSADKKVVIINNFEFANIPAQNALLKVLEEPPEYILFLLTLSSEKDMLDTIKSRTVLLRMEPYTKEEIKSFLKARTTADEGTIEFLSSYCGGNTGKGKLLAEDEEFAEIRREVFKALFHLTENKSVIPFSELVGKDSKLNIKYIIECTTSFFRDMLMYKLGLYELAVNKDYSDRLKNASEKIKADRILKVIEDIIEADVNLQRNINHNLALMSVVFGSMEEING